MEVLVVMGAGAGVWARGECMGKKVWSVSVHAGWGR